MVVVETIFGVTMWLSLDRGLDLRLASDWSILLQIVFARFSRRSGISIWRFFGLYVIFWRLFIL